MTQVIECQEPVEEHQLGVRKRQVILRVLPDVFQQSNHIVSEVSNGARHKRGQSRHSRRMMLLQQSLHHLKDVGFDDLTLASTLDLNFAMTRPNPHVGIGPQKRVAANLLAALHGLQQERVRLFLGDGQKCTDRGKQVGANRLHHRHQGRLARQPRELVEIRLKHDVGLSLYGQGAFTGFGSRLQVSAVGLARQTVVLKYLAHSYIGGFDLQHSEAESWQPEAWLSKLWSLVTLAITNRILNIPSYMTLLRRP
jgi:hypothetical protein